MCHNCDGIIDIKLSDVRFGCFHGEKKRNCTQKLLIFQGNSYSYRTQPYSWIQYTMDWWYLTTLLERLFKLWRGSSRHTDNQGVAVVKLAHNATGNAYQIRQLSASRLLSCIWSTDVHFVVCWTCRILGWSRRWSYVTATTEVQIMS